MNLLAAASYELIFIQDTVSIGVEFSKKLDNSFSLLIKELIDGIKLLLHCGVDVSVDFSQINAGLFLVSELYIVRVQDIHRNFTRVHFRALRVELMIQFIN